MTYVEVKTMETTTQIISGKMRQYCKVFALYVIWFNNV